jgi:methylmalonyl-CoA/ethylmalonyl-CoA epimerase
MVLELMQPGPGPSPWRDHLDRHGQGVFHVCLQVDDRRAFQRELGEIGVGLPYHVGNWPGGSYSYVDTRAQLGLELSVNHQADHTQLMQALLSGAAQPFDEMR